MGFKGQWPYAWAPWGCYFRGKLVRSRCIIKDWYGFLSHLDNLAPKSTIQILRILVPRFSCVIVSQALDFDLPSLCEFYVFVSPLFVFHVANVFERIIMFHKSFAVRIAYGSMSLYIAILHNVFLLYYVDIFVSVYKIDRNSFWLGEVSVSVSFEKNTCFCYGFRYWQCISGSSLQTNASVVMQRNEDVWSIYLFLKYYFPSGLRHKWHCHLNPPWVEIGRLNKNKTTVIVFRDTEAFERTKSVSDPRWPWIVIIAGLTLAFRS